MRRWFLIGGGCSVIQLHSRAEGHTLHYTILSLCCFKELEKKADFQGRYGQSANTLETIFCRHQLQSAPSSFNWHEYSAVLYIFLHKLTGFLLNKSLSTQEPAALFSIPYIFHDRALSHQYHPNAPRNWDCTATFIHRLIWIKLICHCSICYAWGEKKEEVAYSEVMRCVRAGAKTVGRSGWEAAH